MNVTDHYNPPPTQFSPIRREGQLQTLTINLQLSQTVTKKGKAFVVSGAPMSSAHLTIGNPSRKSAANNEIYRLRTWVGLTIVLTVPPPYPVAMPILPDYHLPQQNLSDKGIAKKSQPN